MSIELEKHRDGFNIHSINYRKNDYHFSDVKYKFTSCSTLFFM